MKLNSNGLPTKEAELLASELNVLLANFQIQYQNLRDSNQNIRVKIFFDLHLIFRELYNDSQIKIDLITERVLNLEATPLHTFEDYIKFNQLKIGKNIHKDEQAIELIVSSLSNLLKIERIILKESGNIEDEETNSMMSDFIAI